MMSEKNGWQGLGDLLAAGLLIEGLSGKRDGNGSSNNIGCLVLLMPLPWEILGTLCLGGGLVVSLLPKDFDPIMALLLVLAGAIAGAWGYVRLHRWGLCRPPARKALFLFSGALWAFLAWYVMPETVGAFATVVLVALVFALASVLKAYSMRFMLGGD